jgi:hypothetical protein
LVLLALYGAHVYAARESTTRSILARRAAVASFFQKLAVLFHFTCARKSEEDMLVEDSPPPLVYDVIREIGGYLVPLYFRDID